MFNVKKGKDALHLFNSLSQVAKKKRWWGVPLMVSKTIVFNGFSTRFFYRVFMAVDAFIFIVGCGYAAAVGASRRRTRRRRRRQSRVAIFSVRWTSPVWCLNGFRFPRFIGFDWASDFEEIPPKIIRRYRVFLPGFCDEGPITNARPSPVKPDGAGESLESGRRDR